MHSGTKYNGVNHACDLCVFHVNRKANLKNHAETKHTGLSYNFGKCDCQASWKAKVKVLMVKIHSGKKYNVPNMLSWQGKGIFLKNTNKTIMQKLNIIAVNATFIQR